MTLPLINRIYEYNDRYVIIWRQDLFKKVYLRTIPINGVSTYYWEYWWKFMLKAKVIK